MGISIVKMNKKGLEFKAAFFAIIAFSLFITAAGIMVTEMGTQYNPEATFNLDQYNKLDEISEVGEDQQSRLSPDNANPGTDFEASTFTGAFGVIKTLFQSFNLVFGANGLLEAAASQFFIPSYIIQGIVTMMVIAIAMGIVAVVFRLSRRSA